MKAIRAASVASLEEYTEVELALPEPAAGEVRIAVAACGVGYVDALVALGRYQVKPPLPHIPGNEITGRVDAVAAKAPESSDFLHAFRATPSSCVALRR